MDKAKIIELLGKFRPPFLDLMGAEIVDVDTEKMTCTMHFNIPKEYCHSVDIVQGGFVTAMLDSVSSHAVFACNPDALSVSTLELKVSYLAPSKAGRFTCIGKIEKLTRNFAFLSAELFQNEVRTAILTSTAKVGRVKKNS